ncbi:MAG: S41 family peptidase [Candidatus Aminicenantes bacterium]|nr:S41 family peptidase [Candidatus Aminicenantes bacterium]
MKNHRVKFLFFVFIILALTIIAMRTSAAENPKMPDTSAGRCVAAYIRAFNSIDDAQMTKFIEQYYSKSDLEERPVERQLKRYHQLRDIFKTLTPVYLGLSLERQLSLLCKASGTDAGIVLRYQLKDSEADKIEFTTVAGINYEEKSFFSMTEEKRREIIDYTANRTLAVDEILRKETVEKAAKALEEEYLFPEMGKKVADMLLENLSSGLYDDQTRAGRLADKLTDDMVHISKDIHLWIEARNPLVDQSIYPENYSIEELRRDNYGFRKTEVMPDNIGYIKFDMIHDDEEALEIAASALASVADCEALIFDIRDNIGGEWGVANLIISYLLNEQTTINYLFDRTGKIIETKKTLEDIPGMRFDPDLPVYILTSRITASAAEAFAYALKHFNRATVVGETTIGAAHPSKEIVLNKIFRMSVPFRRSENAVTKTDWENVGVIPHIKVKASEALKAALEDAKKRKKN